MGYLVRLRAYLPHDPWDLVLQLIMLGVLLHVLILSVVLYG